MVKEPPRPEHYGLREWPKPTPYEQMLNYIPNPIQSRRVIQGDAVAWILTLPDQWANGRVKAVKMAPLEDDDLITIVIGNFQKKFWDDIENGDTLYFRRSHFLGRSMYRDKWENEKFRSLEVLRYKHMRQVLLNQSFKSILKSSTRTTQGIPKYAYR